MVLNVPIGAAAEGLPAFIRTRKACNHFIETRDENVLVDVVGTRAGLLSEVVDKARALAAYTPGQLRTSDIGRSLAASVASDLTRDRDDRLHLLPITDPIEREFAEAYSVWLFYERRILCDQLYPGFSDSDAFVPSGTFSEHFHIPWNGNVSAPSKRAASVLQLVGAMPKVPDPMLELVTKWNQFAAELDALPDDEVNAFYKEHLEPIQGLITRGPAPETTSLQGAVAAIRQALSSDDMEDQDANLVRSALAYLERRVAA